MGVIEWSEGRILIIWMQYQRIQVIIMDFYNLTKIDEIEDHFKKSNLYRYLIKDLIIITEIHNLQNIYHYTNTSSLYSILENEELWISRYDFLNDKSEGVYFWNLFFDIIKKENIDSNFLELLKFFSTINLKQDSFPIKSTAYDFYIFSLSKSSDSITLWSNYSNNDGYNIGFNVTKIIDLINKFNIKQNEKVRENKILFIDKIDYGKIIYNKEEQINLIKTELNYFKKESSSIDKEKLLLFSIVFIERMRIYSFFLKNELFHHEEEIRIIFTVDKNNVKDINFRDKENYIIPYIKLKFGNIIKLDFIDYIKIGPKNKIDISNLGLNKYCEKKKLNNIKVLNSDIPLR